MSTSPVPPLDPPVRISLCGDLPVAAAFCRRIGLAATVNRVVATEMAEDVGTVFQAMVLDTLSGRSPLYRLSDFVASLDTELLLGREVAPGAFNDTTVGRVLDAVFGAGAQSVFSAVALQAAVAFPPDYRHVHFDTTSKSLWGDYERCGRDPSLLNVTYGKSKDHRPDLKQIVVEMLCAGGNIPIFGQCDDGNASDKTLNHELLSSIARRLREHGVEEGAFLYIADCAVVTEENLELLRGNRFVTRLPFSYGEAGRAVSEAVTAGVWEEVGRLSESQGTARRPAAEYRVAETTVALYGTRYRALVVHSSSHDRRRAKRLEREVGESERKARELLAAETRRQYFCRKDAEAGADALRQAVTDLHRFETTVEEMPVYGPGRPPRNRPRKPASVRYAVRGAVLPQAEKIRRRQEEAGCFVLFTSVPRTGEGAMTAVELQRAYKEQFGIERNFSFLKDPAIVNSLFLKKPERIEALGAVLLVALLVANLIERSLRNHVAATAAALPGWDAKPTRKPTSFMLRVKFANVMVARGPDGRRFAAPLAREQERYLQALGMSPEDFLSPYGVPA